MRITAPSLLVCGLLALAALRAAPNVDTPYTRLSKLASYLSAGDAVGGLEAFDRSMPHYGEIAANIQALAAQAEVLCSIDVVADKEADNDAADIHHLDLDWYMMVKSLSDTSLVERRRQRVEVTMQRFQSRGKSPGIWRITSMAPEQILAPIAIP